MSIWSKVGRGGIGAAMRSAFGSGPDADWDAIEDALLLADVGAATADEIVTRLKSARGNDVDEAVNSVLLPMVAGDWDRSLHVTADSGPAVILMVGVNGSGKTTTTGKLAKRLRESGKSLVLGAADTFRAGAADQLQTWGERTNTAVVRGPEGADPASVAHDAVATGVRDGVDVVVIDTAGRLHTKQGLMDELGKLYRVVSKQGKVTEVLLVIDATTGQNGLAQAKVFSEVVPLTGIVLTKLDGTAKGGIVIAVQRELGVPVKLVGLGEGVDDLVDFDPVAFTAALLGND